MYHPNSENFLQLLESVGTPALVYDQTSLNSLIARIGVAKDLADIDVLYAVKAASTSRLMQLMSPHLDGFAVSSPLEAQFVKELFPDSETHFTSPGVRPTDIPGLRLYCDRVSFNSRTHAARYAPELAKTTSLGIRVNTGISRAADPRYDPCGPGSKLGIPISELSEFLTNFHVSLDGLHIHTNADSTDLEGLVENVDVLCCALPDNWTFKWVNLGGGYLLDEACLDPLLDAAGHIRAHFDARVFIEPGAALVRSAGFLVGSVIDLFYSDGQRVAVLDTSVNHAPEVLEFGYKPGVVGQTNDGQFEYSLAGATCLAGDVFGTYRFAEALTLGQKVAFEEMGAYTLVKAHRFNGVNLPTVVLLCSDGRQHEIKSFTYRDFASFWRDNG